MRLKLGNMGIAAMAAMVLSGCAGDDQLVVAGGLGVTSTLSTCPEVAIPNYAGDITLFDPVNSRDASAIDVVAQVTNLRSTCNEGDEKLYSEATFDVIARRSFAEGARTVELPYFSTVVRGGSAVIAKRVGTVTLTFPDGEYRAQASAKAASYVDRANATLPDDVLQRITAKRKSGDASAAIDPLADPTVRAALNRARFELLIGFQLTQDQLQYNATR
ncbi:hypothetical protein ACR9YC_09650 [Parasphingorhabdus sp. DH2-15]|uniref:hypothetical protein n=1 Tax=Parasphingorhabdus sp. DH2-15 TaxID=3444112 RepID=UPI003F6871DA